jgi:hypothetical protein
MRCASADALCTLAPASAFLSKSGFRRNPLSCLAGSAALPDADAPSIMVATDLAARGLDFPGSIDHVINFDFPSNAIDFLHRCGQPSAVLQAGSSHTPAGQPCAMLLFGSSAHLLARLLCHLYADCTALYRWCVRSIAVTSPAMLSLVVAGAGRGARHVLAPRAW